MTERKPGQWIEGYLAWLEAGNRGSAQEYIESVREDDARATLDRLRIWLSVNVPSSNDNNVSKAMLWNLLRSVEEIVKED